MGGWRIRVLLLNYNSHGMSAPVLVWTRACTRQRQHLRRGAISGGGLRSVLVAFLTASEALEWVSRSFPPREEDGVEREEEFTRAAWASSSS